MFNIIEEWNDLVTIPDIESIRVYSTLVRKSVITLEQCAQGFRFINILSNLGISDQFDGNNTLNSEFDYAVKNSSLDEKVRIIVNEYRLKNVAELPN